MPLNADDEFFVWQFHSFDNIINGASINNEVVHWEIDFIIVYAVNEDLIGFYDFVQVGIGDYIIGVTIIFTVRMVGAARNGG